MADEMLYGRIALLRALSNRAAAKRMPAAAGQIRDYT
jgi:hypothetical protein